MRVSQDNVGPNGRQGLWGRQLGYGSQEVLLLALRGAVGALRRPAAPMTALGFSWVPFATFVWVHAAIADVFLKGW